MTDFPNREDEKTARSSAATMDVEAHYKSLSSYFKWLVYVTFVALGVVIAVGLYFFHRDMSQLRLEARAAIDAEIDAANRQISEIREDAANIALTEARQRVEVAFRTANVESMVESAARRQVGRAIERHVRDEVDRVIGTLQDEITTAVELADLAMKMRIGLRDGLDELGLKAKTARSEKVRRRAKELFDSVVADYESVHQARIREYGLNSVDLVGINRSQEGGNIVPALVRVIRTTSSLGELADAFLALRDATGVPFRMFDVEAVEQWCKEHKATC